MQGTQISYKKVRYFQFVVVYKYTHLMAILNELEIIAAERAKRNEKQFIIKT